METKNINYVHSPSINSILLVTSKAKRYLRRGDIHEAEERLDIANRLIDAYDKDISIGFSIPNVSPQRLRQHLSKIIESADVSIRGRK